jgi:ketosteroid isomerase-like protein
MNIENVSSFQQLVTRYGEAWNRGDLNAIMSMHAQDTVYHLHGFGDPYQGWKAVHDIFASQLASYQALAFEIRSLHCGDAHVVFETMITGTTLAGVDLCFDAIDLLTIRDGLIATKDSYALRNQRDGKDSC